MRGYSWIALLMAAGALSACASGSEAPTGSSEDTATAAFVETGSGHPYQLKDTQVWDVPDPVSGRRYQVFVSLPASYEQSPQRRYPVLYVTDADYGFPLIRSVARRVNLEGPAVEEFILVGLSYAADETGATSRRRDYTPTPDGPKTAPAGAVHGQSAAYRRYLREQALPFVERRFRAEPTRRVFMGHSYGGLLGAEILFTEPTLFGAYILGSPSLWYDDRHVLEVEAAYAKTHRDLPASVFMYIGAFETVRTNDPRYNKTMDMVDDLKRFEQQLRSRDYKSLTIASTVLPDENHLTVFPSGLTRGLLHVLPAS